MAKTLSWIFGKIRGLWHLCMFTIHITVIKMFHCLVAAATTTHGLWIVTALVI